MRGRRAAKQAQQMALLGELRTLLARNSALPKVIRLPLPLRPR